MANVLIAGCGELGIALAKTLSDSGHSVTGIRRDGSKLPSFITPISADLSRTLPELSSSFDYVFYMASAGKYKDAAYYQAYVQGPRNLIKALSNQTQLKRTFFISSSSVFGQSDGELVNENSVAEAHGFSSERILEGEEIFQDSAIATTVVRFSGIYGPGRTHLIDLVLQGKAHCVEDVWSNRIHVEDCVGVLEHLMNQDRNGNEIAPLYIGVDDTPTPSCEVYEWLAEELCVSNIDHREPTENSRLLRSNKRLSNALIKSTGYEFKYPSYQDGYGELINDLSDDG